MKAAGAAGSRPPFRQTRKFSGRVSTRPEPRPHNKPNHRKRNVMEQPVPFCPDGPGGLGARCADWLVLSGWSRLNRGPASRSKLAGSAIVRQQQMRPRLNKRQRLVLRRVSLGGHAGELEPDWSLAEPAILADLTARGLIEIVTSNGQSRYRLTDSGSAMLYPLRLHQSTTTPRHHHL